MAQAPNTWQMLQAIQWRIQQEILVAGASPFDTFSATDQAKFGANPSGTVTNAIYIGFPKDITTAYKRQCHIIPAIDETVYRRALGGKVWDEQFIYVRFVFNNVADWYGAQQALIAARDVAHVVMLKHAELPAAPIVQAAKEAAKAGGMPTGFHFDEILGRDWVCWGLIWWHRQEYSIPGGIVS